MGFLAIVNLKNSFQSYEDWEELGNFEPDLEKCAKHIDDLKNREQELISNLFSISYNKNGCMCSVLPRTYFNSKHKSQLAKLTYTTCYQLAR